MLRVMRNHRRAAHGETEGYEACRSTRWRSTTPTAPTRSWWHATAAWDKALELAKKHGYRNAQATVIAPTGTIGLVMDCDTTGIEPDFALVKFKKLAGGGYFKIINRAVPAALETLGYTEAEIAEIEAYAVGHGTLTRRRHQPHLAQGQGLHRRRSRRSNGAASRLRHQVRLQQVDAGRGLLHQTLGCRPKS
jgi:ribonucleoside-diphosphate reductase alpha chain